MAVFGVHVFRRRGPFVFDAWPELTRVENCPPRRNAPVEALGVLLGRSPPWPNKRPGVEDTGGEGGEYRALAPMALLDFEIIMLDL